MHQIMHQKDPLSENELVVFACVEAMSSGDILDAKEQIEPIIDSLIPPLAGGIYACEEDILEKSHLLGFALRLLAKKFQ